MNRFQGKVALVTGGARGIGRGIVNQLAREGAIVGILDLKIDLAKAAAAEVIDNLYDYGDGKVFFKPTLASGKNTFRPTREGAISYFVGGNREFPEDSGFALKNWAMVRYDNNASENGIQIFGNIAITMGNMYFTNTKGEQVMVDKTFVFRKGKDGKLRLCVHKSALPFDPAK